MKNILIIVFLLSINSITFAQSNDSIKVIKNDYSYLKPMLSYIKDNFKYPTPTLKEDHTISIKLLFDSENNNVIRFEIIKGVNELYDNEIRRVLREYCFKNNLFSIDTNSNSKKVYRKFDIKIHGTGLIKK